MWKKALAVCSIVPVILLAISMVFTLLREFGKARMPETQYDVGYAIGTGLGVLIMGALLFFWTRWIRRTLAPTRTVPNDDDRMSS